MVPRKIERRLDPGPALGADFFRFSGMLAKDFDDWKIELIQ